MRYYIIAGEASGDLHASNLVKAIKERDIESDFRCWGGDLLQKQGATLAKHYKDLAFMGFVEVVLNLRTILSNLKFCKADILKYRPDVVILIDYPGFNLKLVKFLKKNNIRVVYYITPQIWAWNLSRVKLIQKYVSEVYPILPFEADFFAKYGVDAKFLGHPLLDAIKDYKDCAEPSIADIKSENGLAPASVFSDNSIEDNTIIDRKEYITQTAKDSYEKINVNAPKPIIAILPGSRKQELQRIFPIMLQVCKYYPNFRFIVAATMHLSRDYYDKLMSAYPEVEIVFNDTYNLLSRSYAAIIKSGTSTLETALFKVPEVVCYKGQAISYLIARLLVKNIKYISLVNLILDKPCVKELIQNELTVDNLKVELDKIVYDKAYRADMLNNFDLLEDKLGKAGSSQRVAEHIVNGLLKDA